MKKYFNEYRKNGFISNLNSPNELLIQTADFIRPFM